MKPTEYVENTFSKLWERTLAADVYDIRGDILFVEGWKLSRSSELELLNRYGPDVILVYKEDAA